MEARVIPDHVPPELVYDFDYRKAATDAADPFSAYMDLDREKIPDIFYSPLLGGYWVVRRYDHVLEIFQGVDKFTTTPIVIPVIEAQPVRFLPIQADPPEHTHYRRVMGPLFTPAATRRADEAIRATAITLIDNIMASGETDFVSSYASKFPPLVFLALMDMPTDRVEEFVRWASDVVIGAPEQQAASGQNIAVFVSEFIDRKYAKPGNDWASILIEAKNPDGSPALSREQVINITFFLFLAGLDTVVNALSHTWRFLANNPKEQMRFVEQPELIGGAIEELLRYNTITNNSRRVRHDMVFGGVDMKEGDAILLLVSVANRDASQFSDGQRIDLEREQNLHMTFGAGIHRCIGSNIARAELRISIEEWLKRVPSFRIKEGADIRSAGGATVGLKSLPLVWDRAA